jgi:hypothetical protein
MTVAKSAGGLGKGGQFNEFTICTLWLCGYFPNKMNPEALVKYDGTVMLNQSLVLAETT